MWSSQRVIAVLGTATALVVTPAEIRGQDQGSGLHLEVGLKLGPVVPLNKLEAGTIFEDSSALVFDRATPAFGAGLTVEIHPGTSPWGARATLLYSFSGRMQGEWSCARRPRGGCPDILVQVDAESSILAAVGDLVYGPVPVPAAVAPYGMLGIGLKRYRIKWPGDDAHFIAGTNTTTDLAIHVGGGARMEWRGLTVWFEVEDYISRFGVYEDDRGTKHDLAVTLGWRFVLF